MGLGALGTPVATVLAQLGFPVRGWSRSLRSVNQVASFAGPHELPVFLDEYSSLEMGAPERGKADARPGNEA